MKELYIIFIGGFLVLLAVIGAFYVLRKRFPAALTPQQQNTLLGPFSFLITLYAFLLGFIVVNLWQTFDQADRTAANEAETISVLLLHTDSFPGSEVARQTLMDYTQSIIRDEWPAMSVGKKSPKTEALHVRAWQEICNLTPSSAREQAIYEELLDQLSNLTHYRRARLLLIGGSIPSMMWWTLVFGGLLLFIGLYYLSIGNTREQMVMDVLVMGMLLLTLYLAVEFNEPFQGNLKVLPRAFELIEPRMPPTPR
jgi:hypothetical protein